MSRRGEQHPFTPEPREPEGWPERDATPWEWAGGEADHAAKADSETVADMDVVRKWLKARRKAHAKRGFSIGFR